MMRSLSLTALAFTASMALSVPAAADSQRHGDRWQRGPAHAQHYGQRTHLQARHQRTHSFHQRPQVRHSRSTETPLPSEQPFHHAQRTGPSAYHYQRFYPQAHHRIAAPPRGHHYRHQGKQVILVNDHNLQIVAIVGLLSALLR